MKFQWNEKTRALIIDGLIGCYLLAIYYSIFDVRLAFENTHVSGGDMISHPVIADTMKQLWAHGHFWGWSNSWFGGYPFLYFYFYPVYVLDLLLQFFDVPEAIAFKLVVLMVVTLVPLGHYFFSRRWLSRPAAFLIAAMGTAVFMNEADSIGGGSFKSVLAGQVSHQLGLMAVVAFFSYIVRREHDRRGSVLTFTFAILCHVYSALFAGILAVIYVIALAIEKKSVSYALRETKRWWLAIGLSSFFWLPFLWYHRWTVIPINHTQISWTALASALQTSNSLYVFIYVLATATFFVLAVTRKATVLQCLLFSFCILLILFIPYSQGTPILHVRLLAEIYLIAIFIFGLSLRVWDQQLLANVSGWGWRWGVFGILGFLVLQSFVPSSLFDRVLPQVARHEVKEIPSWWSWNMSGIEGKPQSVDVLQVWNFMKGIRDTEGRFAVEYNDYGAYGSPRIFEFTPTMTGKPIMEGLLLESSVTYPMYYYSMLESNPSTWWPGFNLKVPVVDPLKTIEHLALFNVRHFIASRPATKEALKRAHYQPAFENRQFSVFDVNSNSRIANVLEGEIPVIQAQQPIMLTIDRMPESLGVFSEIELRKGVEMKGPLPRPTQTLSPLDAEWSNDGQSIKIGNTGASATHPKNIMFKIPYFPNWRASNGEDVRLLTGQLMLVTTKSPTLTLQFRPGWIEYLSAWISIGSLIVLFALDLPPFEDLWSNYFVRPLEIVRARLQEGRRN